MSCFNNNCYLPQPPRAWSRVQNSCSLITDSDNNSLVKDPYTGQLVPAVVLAERISMLNKGNVLQYKANSSNLTKVQKYSKIAKGQWVNRNTTWATQSTRGYTNPNTTNLKRTGDVDNIAIDPITGTIIGPTAASITCPQHVIPTNEGLPSNVGESIVYEPTPIPSPVPPTPGSETFPNIIADTPVEPIVIQDGGSLICSIQEDLCTGETKRSLSQQLCHPTTDSDVPGPIQDLCWNDGTQTWYPRQRLTMSNSTNKWPVNAELFSAIQINSPYITSITSNKNIVTLTWTFNSDCLPASNFNIYQDGVLVKIVDGKIFTTEIVVNNCNYYQYYIVAENITAKTISEQSNLVDILISIGPPNKVSIISLSYYNGFATATLSWNQTPNCIPLTQITFNLYLDYVLIASNITTNNYIFTGLNFSTLYTFSVSSSTIINGNTITSTIISTSDTTILPFIGGTSYSYNEGIYNIFYDISGSINILSSVIYNLSLILVGGGGGGKGGSTSVGDSKGGGGGGGGETITATTSDFTINTNYNITIGKGGLGSIPGVVNVNPSGNGNNTYVQLNTTTFTALGGFGTSGAYGGNGGGPLGNGGLVSYAGYDGSNVNNITYDSFGGGGGGGGGSKQLNTSDFYFGGGGGGVAIDGSNILNIMSFGGMGGGQGNPNGYPATTTGGNYNGGNGGSVGFIGNPGVYGGGGGGGSGVNPTGLPNAQNGGNGGNGFCVISFTYK